MHFILMKPIVLNMMFCPATKGWHKADPYGDIEMVCIVGAAPCACPRDAGRCYG
jgi:hypothetical protein